MLGMTEIKSKKKLNEEYLKQDFFEHELSNGRVIMVSMDHRYFYRPEYFDD